MARLAERFPVLQWANSTSSGANFILRASRPNLLPQIEVSSKPPPPPINTLDGVAISILPAQEMKEIEERDGMAKPSARTLLMPFAERSGKDVEYLRALWEIYNMSQRDEVATDASIIVLVWADPHHLSTYRRVNLVTEAQSIAILRTLILP